MRSISSLLALAFLTSACTTLNSKIKSTGNEVGEATYKVVSVNDVNWEKLNPARGDKSPQAATLWGDRNDSVETGFLVKFVDGFSSPPHIHNVTYRGVVIEGLVHNDDPAAAKMWMPAGSFWTQPKGERHITAARGKTNIAYIEIDNGPYLVMPAKKAFDSGERPMNIDVKNIVWIKLPGASKAKLSYLWGQPGNLEPYGVMVRLSAGFSGKLLVDGKTLRSTVVAGELKLQSRERDTQTKLPPGSHFASTGNATHVIGADQETTLYVRAESAFQIVP